MVDELIVESFPDEFTVVLVGDEFTVEQWPDEFIILDNSDDWTVYTTTETTYTLELQAVGLNDAAIAVAARIAAVAAQVQADADAAATAADRVQTGLDRTQTGADRTQTGLDRTQTGADRTQTDLDRTAVSADRVQADADAAATAADRVQTGLDRTQTGADRVQTGLDRVATGNDVTAITAMIADMAGGTTNQVLVKQSNVDYDFMWAASTGMLAAIYDPLNVLADAFDRGNHHGTQSADTLTDGVTNKAFLATERTKLAGIATGATANQTDAFLLARANHTGTQLAATISDFSTAADLRVPAATHAAASKATPVDADELPLADSAAAFALKKLTWANLKATVLAYILTVASSWTARQVHVAGATGNSAMATTTASLGELEARGNGTGAAMMAFHRPGVYAAYIGIDTDNVWKVGGWSAGANAYKIWHEGNDGAGSTLDADLLDGQQGSFYLAASSYTAADVLTKIKTVDGAGSGLDADLLDGLNSDATNTINTIAARNASGDLVARLHRTEWGGAGWNGAYFVGMNANGGVNTDNYMRPATPNQALTAIINAGFESAQQTITSAGSLTLAHGLGVKPKLFMAVIQCTTADTGYAVGDEVNALYSTAGTNIGVAVWPDATNMNVRFGSALAVFSIPHKTTGVGTAITPASWKLVVRAWA